MTDFEKVKQLFGELGIGFKEESAFTGKDDFQVISIEEGTEKVEGYSGFVTEFLFDLDGKFVEVGLWE